MADTKQLEESDASTVPHGLPSSSEQDRELALRATSEFDRGDYDACLTTITKLANTRSDDLKVLHNQAVVTYFKSGLTKTDDFKRALTELHSKVSLDEMALLDDVEQCIIYYNHAVILYCAKQYRTAFTVLDKVMQFIEPMDENVSRKAAFLMVELCLCMHQPYKALGMLGFIEKVQFGNSKSTSPDKEHDDVADSKAGRESKESGVDVESWRATLSQYKIRCYLMLKSIKFCKREMKSLIGSISSAMSILFLKSQFEYCRGNYQKAIRMLSSMNSQILAPSGSLRASARNVAAMYYNNLGIMHFHMRKHHLGAFYLRRALDENTKAVLATRLPDSADQSKSPSLSTAALPDIGVSRHYELIFNLGIQLLHCGQPQAAFDCLLEALQQYQVNPYLWLRLAECCIMVQRQNNEVDRSHSKKMEVVCSSVGSGLHRKLILGSGVRIDKSSIISESKAIPMATMEFAALCLDNALLLLPERGTAAAAMSDVVQSSTSPDGNAETRQLTDAVLIPAPPGNPLKMEEVSSLRCSVLACRSYVALHHSDYLVALQYADKLLRQPRLSGAHRYLAHMYMAEALVALDRIADSIDHLNPDLIADISTQPPPEDKTDRNGDGEPPEQSEYKGARYPWSPGNLAQAKAFMLYNLAATHAIRGEHEKALLHLGKVTQPIGQPLPAQLYYLKIYLELMEGHRKVVHSLLRDHFGHVTSGR
jgi:CCR4-NOT transcription complex subunit 10